jgi:uncharacterized BrkB/YihY/UPF0761 family membrane protein
LITSNLPDYALSRLKIPSVLTDFLWLIPCVVGGVTTRNLGEKGLLYCFIYILFISIGFSLFVFIDGQLGNPSDFYGAKGAFLIFKIFFVISFFAIGIGAVVGLLSRKNKSNMNYQDAPDDAVNDCRNLQKGKPSLKEGKNRDQIKRDR